MKPWRERIVERIAAGDQWTAADEKDLWDYNTCLVGEQRALHPEVVVYLPADRDATIRPEDPELLRLGNNVVWMRPSRAALILDWIEDRVLQLKREKGGAS